jgi:hypothetical protein
MEDSVNIDAPHTGVNCLLLHNITLSNLSSRVYDLEKYFTLPIIQPYIALLEKRHYGSIGGGVILIV